MITKLQTGASVKVLINGKDWGDVTGLNLSMGTPRKPIHGIDSPLPFEIAPTVTDVSGQIQLLRQVGSDGLEGKGITASNELIIRERYFTLALQDRVTGKTLFQASHCAVEQQSWQYAARTLVVGTFQFKGLSWTSDYISNVLSRS